MNASKVTISHQTRSRLNNPILTRSKKTHLREELVKDAIRRSFGGRCTKQELIAAAGYSPNSKLSGYANGNAFINGMVNRRIITHNNTTSFRKTWTVLEDVKTVKITPTPQQVAKEVVAKEEVKEVDIKKGVNEIVSRLAKDFVWETGSDSLHDFVEYLSK